MAIEVVQGGARRVGQTDLDLGVALAQRQGDAGQRSAGAGGADESVYSARGLRPDFRAGRLVVSTPVRDIVELLRPDRTIGLGARERLRKTLGDVDVVVRIFVGPAVPSTITPPARKAPRCSASFTIASAARSFTEPPGFKNSALPRISHRV
jgi:hypothetical protein